MTPRQRPKVPRTPPEPLTRVDSDILAVSDPLWRIGKTTGPHALSWDTLREAGPLGHMRWDPHHEPQSTQPDRAVMYAATDVVTWSGSGEGVRDPGLLL